MEQGLSQRLESTTTLDIHDIIRNKRIKVCFQPIVSPNRKNVVGIEGLVRGTASGTEQSISPIALFDAAQNAGVTVELDRLCREKVIRAFKRIYAQRTDQLLFLNVDASILDSVSGSKYLLKQVMQERISPKNIVIEINETKVRDDAALKHFISIYRKYGFMIALDDVGSGFSNLNRIPLAKPDIIKIDMSLIRNMHKDYYKQEVFKALINLANRIGALVVAEGVETAEEAIQTLKLGGHMIQGYYFSKPQENYRVLSSVPVNSKIEQLNNDFKAYMHRKIREEKYRYRQLNAVASRALKILYATPSQDFNTRLAEIVCKNAAIECAYILDALGIQVSDTVCKETEENKNLIFYSASRGADHSMKKYCYRLENARLNEYLTEPYVSLATGNLCITFSRTFKNIENKTYILCMDFTTK